jgi:hypothetical protein
MVIDRYAGKLEVGATGFLAILVEVHDTIQCALAATDFAGCNRFILVRV